ncbi:MAG: chemotaxis protein CheW [Lawsonibacter sp.]|nr:chemotaxis protein CheW [Lawsonibacter sp.]
MLFATEAQQIQQRADQSVEIATEKYLIFSSDNLMYGIKAEQVKDIITDYAITGIPQVPNYVRGVINLRGQIIPMLDIRLRLGKAPQDNFCGIVVDVDGNMVGILVDMVEQMVDVPLGDILPVPTNSGQAMVSGMCTLPDGNTMLELDCGLLLHD